MDYQQIADAAKQQEAMLRFDHFTPEDAWQLGLFLARRVRDAALPLAVRIQQLNGFILFQYGPEGTELNNQNWMQRKFNTAALTGGCTLRAWAQKEIKGQSFEEMGLDAKGYAYCGGGFPIRLRSGELIGAAIVSGLPHMEDHRFLAGALADYLGVQDMPAL